MVAKPKRTRRQAARRAPLASKELERTIVELLSPQPHVRQILLEEAGGELRIWVVIDAEPMAWEQRQSVYAVGVELRRRYPDVSTWIRLLNIAQYGWERLPELLPEDARRIFSR